MSAISHFGALPVGIIPRVVGTICKLDFLKRAAEGKAGHLAADLIEVRLDETAWTPEVFALSKSLQKLGTPCFATIRSSKEGGKFAGEEKARLAIYEEALDIFTGADVELHSGIARDLVALCQAKGKGCIISFHNFQTTPSLGELRNIYEDAAQFASIVKIVTMLNTEGDLATLRELLKMERTVPLCLMGMGPLGRITRLEFPLQGSALTYGYLDAPAAPGQLSAEEIMAHLKSANPA